MIDSIHIKGIATYGSNPEALNNLSKINFLYGSNGSGKTTISKVIADEEIYPTCSVTWKLSTRFAVNWFTGNWSRVKRIMTL